MPATLAIDGGTPVRTTPWPSWPVHDEREVAALREVVESGNWGGFPSPNVQAKRFAEAFAAYHTARFGSCTSSGTAALEVALKAAGVARGDEVIIPALTFVATPAAALYMGAVPVFADIDPDTWCVDPDAVERALTPRTRAIVVVHLGSRMADMDAIMEIARRRRSLRVIEDCAHMHGGAWTSRAPQGGTTDLSGSSPPSPSAPLPSRGAGSIGDLGCFSFQNSKLMTAGEGGLILTNDEELDRRCHAYIDCGRLRPTDREATSQGVFGWNYRMTEFQAAVLNVQLERLPEQTRLREAHKQRLTDRLDGIDGVATLRQDERMTQRSGYGFYFKYSPEANGGIHRDRFLRALRAEGILCYGDFYSPVYRDPLFAWRDAGVDVDYSAVRCPVAERVAGEESIWLPHTVFLGTERDVDDIADAVEKVTEGLRAGEGGTGR
jgi:dTDP-4-amino-4,6-dideoxygalactose transaminase